MNDTSAKETHAANSAQRISGAANLRMHERDTADILRKRFAHALLLAGVGGLAWYFGVQPLERTYAEDRSTRESIEAKIAANNTSTADDVVIDNDVKAMNAKFEAVTRWTAASSDPAALYEELNSLASKHHVTIERIEPSSQQDVLATVDASAANTPRRSRRSSAAVPSTQDKTKWRAKTMSHRMSVVGTYQSICDFVGACENELGASKVRSIVIRQSMNTDDSGRVNAEIETVHLELCKPETPKTSVATPTTDVTSDSTTSDLLMPQESPK